MIPQHTTCNFPFLSCKTILVIEVLVFLLNLGTLGCARSTDSVDAQVMYIFFIAIHC